MSHAVMSHTENIKFASGGVTVFLITEQVLDFVPVKEKVIRSDT